jgi:hypothetical protein
MCADCQAARGHGSGPYPVMTRAELRRPGHAPSCWSGSADSQSSSACPANARRVSASTPSDTPDLCGDLPALQLLLERRLEDGLPLLKPLRLRGLARRLRTFLELYVAGETSFLSDADTAVS